MLSTSPAARPIACTVSKLRSFSMPAARLRPGDPEAVRRVERRLQPLEPPFEIRAARREEDDDAGARLRAELLRERGGGVVLSGHARPQSSSASRSGVSPIPSTSSASASVARAVSASGRHVSPAATAFETSVSMNRRHPGSAVSIQSGSSIHCPTSRSTSQRSSTCVNAASPRLPVGARGEQVAQREGRRDRVEGPRETGLRAPHDPLAEVADVDELHRPLGCARARAPRRRARSRCGQ